MRLAALLISLAACRDHAASAPLPQPAPGPVVTDARRTLRPAPLPPRNEHEVDELGYGKLAIGQPTAQIEHLVEAPTDGHLMRSGTTGFAELEIDAERETVLEAVIRDPDAITRDGIRMGTPFEEIEKRYGQPRIRAGDCRQYAKAPGVAFCGQAAISSFEIPAHRSPPLDLGEDLAAIDAVFDAHALRIANPKTVAPCLLFDGTFDHAAIAQRGEVYATEGGWRRPDGSMVICTASTAIADATVFEIDATGHGARWLFVDGQYFRREPATCTVAPPNLTCNGTSHRARELVGTFVDAFGDTFILPTASIHETPFSTLAESRAIRRDGEPTDACERQLANAWASSVAARTALGLPTDGAARMNYLDAGDAHRFLAACLAGEKAEPPRIDHPRAPERAPYTVAARREREKALVGSWHSVGTHGQLSDWTFTAAGVLVDRTSRTPYSAPRPGVLISGDRMYQFARIDADHFAVADPGFLSGIRCPEDPTRADVEVLAGWLLIRGTSCSMITRTDRFPRTTCTAGPNRTLDVRFEGDDGKPQRFTLEQDDGCYVPDVSVSIFTRASSTATRPK